MKELSFKSNIQRCIVLQRRQQSTVALSSQSSILETTDRTASYTANRAIWLTAATISSS